MPATSLLARSRRPATPSQRKEGLAETGGSLLVQVSRHTLELCLQLFAGHGPTGVLDGEFARNYPDSLSSSVIWMPVSEQLSSFDDCPAAILRDCYIGLYS